MKLGFFLQKLSLSNRTENLINKCQEADYLECFLIPHYTFTYYRVSFSNLYVLMYMGISKHALYITDHSWSKRKFWNNLDERSDTLFSLWECNRVIKRFSHSFCNKFRCLNRNMGEKLLIKIHARWCHFFYYGKIWNGKNIYVFANVIFFDIWPVDNCLKT